MLQNCGPIVITIALFVTYITSHRRIFLERVAYQAFVTCMVEHEDGVYEVRDGIAPGDLFDLAYQQLWLFAELRCIVTTRSSQGQRSSTAQIGYLCFGPGFHLGTGRD